MLERLMPKSDEFFDDFEAQCKATVEGARKLLALLGTMRDVDAQVRAIKELEHVGDAVTRASFARLHKQFITPFDRGQIHRMLSAIDDVLDLVDAVAERLAYYELETPREDATELARILVNACEQVQVAVQALRTIKQPEQILAGCQQVRRWESQADEVLRVGMARLFKSGLDPLSVIKWKEVYDIIETATDRCQTIAGIIEGVVLEHS